MGNGKTDRKEARGIAQLLRMRWYRPVYAKSASAQEVRALLVGRKLLRMENAPPNAKVAGWTPARATT